MRTAGSCASCSAASSSSAANSEAVRCARTPSTWGPVGPRASPVSEGQPWHYSIGHWVEDDPLSGDGAFSSGGTFGFYPWIDATRTTYGVIARVDERGSGRESAKCGRLMREAWVTATAQ